MSRHGKPIPDFLLQYAAQHVACPTPAEQAAREALHYTTKRLLDRNLRKWPILSQYPMPPYIVDFVCLSRRLIIEIDGPYHRTPQQQAYDARRTQYFKNYGYRVLRFSNESVLHRPYRFTQRVKHYLLDLADIP